MPRYNTRRPMRSARRNPLSRRRATTYKRSNPARNWAHNYDHWLTGHTKSISHNPGQYSPSQTVKKVLRTTVTFPVQNDAEETITMNKEGFAKILPGVANVLKTADPTKVWTSPIGVEQWAYLQNGYYWDRVRIESVKLWMSSGIGNSITFQWAGAGEKIFTSRGVTNAVRPSLGLDVPLNFRRWLSKSDLFREVPTPALPQVKEDLDYALFSIIARTGYQQTQAMFVLDVTVTFLKDTLYNFIDAYITPTITSSRGNALRVIPEYRTPDEKKFGKFPLTYPYNPRIFETPINAIGGINPNPFDPDAVNPIDDPTNPNDFPPLPPTSDISDDDYVNMKKEVNTDTKDVFQNVVPQEYPKNPRDLSQDIPHDLIQEMYTPKAYAPASPYYKRPQFSYPNQRPQYSYSSFNVA